MELYCTTNKNKYEINIPQGRGEYYTQCPVCSSQRKPQNQKKKCFGWSRDKKIAHCSHCNSSFVEFREFEKQDTTTNDPQPKLLSKINSIPFDFIQRSLGTNSNFGYFLQSNFTQEEIVTIMNKYQLGMTKDSSVIYWYIDKESRVRSGKIIQYDKETGKRVKSEMTSISWVHSKMKKNNQLPMDWSFTRCLFGEHLLKSNPNANICLVESEKTAIIASVYMPNQIWLATGGLNMFNETVCRVLKDRKVIIFPDLGATQLWKDKASEISKNVGCKMVINEKLEDLSSEEQKKQGLDIGDFLLGSKI